MCLYFFGTCACTSNSSFWRRANFRRVDILCIQVINQSQRANKLHAHCILRVKACESDINKSLTADLCDLCPSFGVNYEPRARHQCGEKCTGRKPGHTIDNVDMDTNYTCKYGFPVTEYASETFCRSGKTERETVYRRSKGMERIVPFYPIYWILKAVYPAHGADMVMSSTVMAAYTGKYG